MATDYDAFDAILHHIFKQTQGQAWFKPTEESMQVGLFRSLATSVELIDGFSRFTLFRPHPHPF
jgi:hypothetical protein